MRQGSNGLFRWVLASVLLAAVGCEGEGTTGPGEPVPPNDDPMKIGQTDLPKPDKPVEVSAMNGAEFPTPSATSFITAKDLEETGSSDPGAQRAGNAPPG